MKSFFLTGVYAAGTGAWMKIINRALNNLLLLLLLIMLHPQLMVVNGYQGLNFCLMLKANFPLKICMVASAAKCKL